MRDKGASNITEARDVFIKFAQSQEDSERIRYFLDGMDLLADEGSQVAVRMMETHTRELFEQMPSSLPGIVEGLVGKKPYSWFKEKVAPADLLKVSMLLEALAGLDDEVFYRALRGVKLRDTTP